MPRLDVTPPSPVRLVAPTSVENCPSVIPAAGTALQAAEEPPSPAAQPPHA